MFFGLNIRRVLSLRVLATLAVSSIIILTITSCLGTRSGKTTGGSANMYGFDGRVIILGMDGLSTDIVEPMMKAGDLPNFAKLAQQGCYHRMTTTNPSQSPVAWTGFSTGQNGGKNGLFDFIKRDPESYILDLSTSKITGERVTSVVKAKHWWDYASEANTECSVIRCPVTFPPDEIKGHMISGMGVPDVVGTEGTFSFFTTEPVEGKDTGGHVEHVSKSANLDLELIGPKKAGPGGKPVDTTVPFVVNIDRASNKASIEIQGNRFELKPGEWSEWKNVAFPIGFLRKMKGIAKFYLVEVNPEFKLYVSPVNHDPRDPFYPIFYPKGYGKELVDQIGLFSTLGMPNDTWSVNEKRLTEEPFLQRSQEITDQEKKVMNIELNRVKAGIVYMYFDATDLTQHMFWRYTDPESPLYEPNSPYKNTIRDLYKEMDTILGEVMAKMGPKDTIIVMSDHGFASFRRAAHVNSWLRKNGYLQLKDPNAPSGGDLLADVDWLRTKAYAIGFGGVYINQSGREGSGIVSPGAETEALKKELKAKLLTWTDDEKGHKIINNVYLGDDIFHGPYAKDAPDLCIGFNDGYRASWQTALGGAPAKLVEDNDKKWSGDHLIDPALVPAVLFSNKKLADNPTIYDLAPTILKLIGFSDDKIKACDFDGKPLF